jgi:hypothetical protein
MEAEKLTMSVILESFLQLMERTTPINRIAMSDFFILVSFLIRQTYEK